MDTEMYLLPFFFLREAEGETAASEHGHPIPPVILCFLRAWDTELQRH